MKINPVTAQDRAQNMDLFTHLVCHALSAHACAEHAVQTAFRTIEEINKLSAKMDELAAKSEGANV